MPFSPSDVEFDHATGTTSLTIPAPVGSAGDELAAFLLVNDPIVGFGGYGFVYSTDVGGRWFYALRRTRVVSEPDATFTFAASTDSAGIVFNVTDGLGGVLGTPDINGLTTYSFNVTTTGMLAGAFWSEGSNDADVTPPV